MLTNKRDWKRQYTLFGNYDLNQKRGKPEADSNGFIYLDFIDDIYIRWCLKKKNLKAFIFLLENPYIEISSPISADEKYIILNDVWKQINKLLLQIKV